MRYIYSQNDNSGEKFIRSNSECKNTTPAPLPSFVSKPEFKNGSMSVKISTPAGSDLKDVYYAVLLTADLTIPLDQAASTAGVDKGVAVCKQYSASSIGSDATINVSLDPKLTGTESKVLNERYYVAIAAYRCNWNARDNDGKLLPEFGGLSLSVSLMRIKRVITQVEKFDLSKRSIIGHFQFQFITIFFTDYQKYLQIAVFFYRLPLLNYRLVYIPYRLRKNTTECLSRTTE